MPDPKNKQAQGQASASSNEGSGNEPSELDQLRQELGVFKTNYETSQKELETLRERYDERENQYLRDYGRQGQELGEKIKNLQGLIDRAFQPAETQGKKKRQMAVSIPDNVTAQDEFLKFQQDLVSQVYDLQDKISELEAVGGQVTGLQAELKKTQEDLNLARYESYVAKEESLMRSDYGLDDRDLKRVRDYMKDSGIYSMEAAAIKVPGVKEKMFSSYAQKHSQSNGNGYEELEEEKPKRKSRYSAEQIGKEMLETKPDNTIPRGGAKRVEENSDWTEEMKAALKDGSFFHWPQSKQDDYTLRLQQSRNGAYTGM